MEASPTTAQATPYVHCESLQWKILMTLFSTHPSTEERIRRLRAMGVWRNRLPFENAIGN